MTLPIDRVRDALAALCAKAGVARNDTSKPAAEAVVGLLRRTGCFSDKFADDLLLPEMCPLAAWLRLEAAVPLDVSLFVSRETGITGREKEPGRIILLGELVVGGPSRIDQRENAFVELPWAVTAAVRLIDESYGMAGTEGAKAA